MPRSQVIQPVPLSLQIPYGESLTEFFPKVVKRSKVHQPFRRIQRNQGTLHPGEVHHQIRFNGTEVIPGLLDVFLPAGNHKQAHLFQSGLSPHHTVFDICVEGADHILKGTVPFPNADLLVYPGKILVIIDHDHLEADGHGI